ncbi:MAG: PIN domain-containing protein [Candidatus Aminicenantes bacterium]|nr:PIN domain-containing protein [Candidatus Aminicenantes bacterium]
MRDSVFFDTNVLIYNYSNEEEKKEKSINLAAKNDGIISLQVINEFVNVLKKKFKKKGDEILDALAEIEASFTIRGFSLDLIKRAVSLSSKYEYSYFDCLIIASAIDSSCSILFTEDMQHNQLVEKKLRIINPFV